MISKNFLMMVMVSVLATLVLGIIPGPKLENKQMAFAGKNTAVKDAIPPIDRNVPATTQTATFALG